MAALHVSSTSAVSMFRTAGTVSVDDYHSRTFAISLPPNAAGLHSSPVIGQFPSLSSNHSLRVRVAKKAAGKLTAAAARDGEGATEEGSSGTGTGIGAANGSGPSETGKPKIIRRRKNPTAESPAAANLEMRAVEGTGVAVEGVARIDREGNSSVASILRVAGLAAGDLAALLLFSWIGRASHVSTAVDWELLKTADPFIAGWVTAAYFLGDYLPNNDPPKGVKASAASAAKTWAVGVPLGIAIRSLNKGQLPQLPFVGVSMASTLVLLVGWRTARAALIANKEEGKEKAGGNRQGNPLEFLELLTSLVRRW